MEQRAPGHTAADGKLYAKGMLDFKADIREAMTRIDPAVDPSAMERLEELRAMDIAADAAILFAERYAALARELAAGESDPARRAELERIAEVCTRVPAQAPRDFWEAIQMYWFCHLGVITELNGWDAFSPGHLDQHLEPFWRRGIADGTLTRERPRSCSRCLFVKFNNQLAPPKVGVTDAESATYTDFADINLAGLHRDGTDASGEVSELLLEVIDEMHLVQPSPNVQISRQTPEALPPGRVPRHSQGVRLSGRLQRRRRGHPAAAQGQERRGRPRGRDQRLRGDRRLRQGGVHPDRLLQPSQGPGAGTSRRSRSPDRRADRPAHRRSPLVRHLRRAVRRLGDAAAPRRSTIKLRGNALIEQTYAREMPAPFLSLITADCISRGLDYNAGGARYNTSYLQGVGIGTLTDSLASLKTLVFEKRTISMDELLERAVDGLRRRPRRSGRRCRNRAPKWGNDDEAADALMRAAFTRSSDAVDGRPNGRGGTLRGRHAADDLAHLLRVGHRRDARRETSRGSSSEGISPSQGMDRLGPTAVIRSMAKMDQARTCGTLLNMKLSPGLVDGDDGIAKLAGLIRTYFRLGGHHVQFNVVSAETLREAQLHPDEHRDLIVRVAGYSDYFCNLSRSLQDEIIARTEHERV